MRRSGRTRAARRAYDRVAPAYGWYRERWLALAGAPAEAAMHRDVQAALRPGQRVLDAGAGTGAVSREILRRCPGVDVTMVDASAPMLAEAGDVAAARVQAAVEALPFPDGHFDIVVAGWVIETVPDPARAVSELLRVLAPGGRLVYTVCSRPAGALARVRTAPLRAAVRLGFAGRFLSFSRVPWHDCAAAHRESPASGVATEVVLGACCRVGPRQPCRHTGSTTPRRTPA